MSFLDGPEFWPLEFDNKRFMRLVEKGRFLSDCIQDKKIPNPEPGESCWFCPAEIKRACPAFKGQNLDFPLLDELAAVKEQVKPLKAKEEELSEQSKNFLRDLENRTVQTEKHIARLDIKARTTVNGKALKTELPEVFEKYSSKTTFETLRID